MQLTKIKLAGFKSFVDPTTVTLPSHLVAIVGPNGCGKSNIIDAVCWVMGENSAKYLRGESLADVIFNGSTTRKPIGQASVELLFDNQDGSLGGEYSSYSEISIKRSISREGDSNYFLNGARCRRRDIIDIFLGTGLGPRSYSIIGQNMISRVIEAKPEEMRVYMEEAAGISKYKERRRETENRISHTKENLARLNDLRSELEKQLSNLQRQANAAEKYKALKQEERIVRSQWHAIQWRELDARLVQYTLQIQQQETGLEARHTEITEIDQNMEKKREDQRLSNENFQEVQKRFYTIGNEITRIEQEIRHTQERHRQWQLDVSQADHDYQDVKQALEQSENKLKELADELAQFTPEMNEANEAAKNAARDLSHAEEAMQDWQTQWDEFNQRIAQSSQIVQVEKTKIQHLEQRIHSIKARQAILEQDQKQIDFSHIKDELEKLSQEATKSVTETENQKKNLNDIREQISKSQTEQQESTKQLDQIRNELQKSRGEQASLEALQETALGQRNQQITKWLSQHQLDKKPRLAQGIEVEKGWENALEKVLGLNLQAVCVDELSDVIQQIDQLKEGTVAVFASNTSKSSSASNATSLLSKIQSKWPLDSLLSGIYVADTIEEALKLSESLAAHESVVTRDGIWLSASWMRVSREERPEAGVFQREQELKQLSKHISELVSQHDQLEKTIKDKHEAIKQLEKQRDALQVLATQAHAHTAEINTQKKMREENLSELSARAKRLEQDLKDAAQQLQQAESELSQSRARFEKASQEMSQQESQRTALTQKRDTARERLLQCREQLSDAQDAAHQFEIRLQTTKSQQSSLQDSNVRMKQQLTTLSERKAVLQQEHSSTATQEELEKSLAEFLKQRLQVEEEQTRARSIMNSIEQEIRAFESRRQEIERETAKLRDILESLRVEWQGLKVKSETILEQLKETGFLLQDVLKDLTEEATANVWQTQHEQITQRISRLGAINLVAIEEYAACEERKSYLDKQNADLQEGLTTLESAIAKIDKETRARFKETFDKVDEQFRQIFPKIFGGGRAYLELTGENLLDSGISVMACPPGKRNSTIHLLSGGEKAMTAIALVFSIFQLNPAPFCLLDEVDAPLDDANIGRFCNLVKEMSNKTQFIFISHNKLAIEMAQHLMGVTMHEPGVSRLVTVNVEEAVSLAGA
jgi:chromosome segregation protein